MDLKHHKIDSIWLYLVLLSISEGSDGIALVLQHELVKRLLNYNLALAAAPVETV